MVDVRSVVIVNGSYKPAKIMVGALPLAHAPSYGHVAKSNKDTHMGVGACPIPNEGDTRIVVIRVIASIHYSSKPIT